MERPPSQLENVRPNASGIKPPSRLPAMMSNGSRNTLLETSQSDLNARNGFNNGSMGPPPSMNGSIKHRIPGLPESVPKRKTLAERAGEPINPSRSHIQPPSKTTLPRGGSYYGHSRRASAVSAIASSNGMRPISRQRPSTAEEEDEDAGVTGKRKGTPVMSFNHTTLRKTRTHEDLRTGMRNTSAGAESSSSGGTSRSASGGSTSSDEGSVAQNHNISITSAFAELSLTPNHHRPSLERISEEVSPSKIPKFSTTPSLRHAHSSLALQTPSPMKHKSSINGLHTPRTSARPKDETPFFLTKDSLTPVKSAWDTKGRLEGMEAMYTQLRTQFASAADSKDALEESLALYKSRVQELTDLNREITTANRNMTGDIERARTDLHTTTTDLRQARRDHERDLLDIERKHDKELSDRTQKLEKQAESLIRERERDTERYRREAEETKQKWNRQKDDEAFEMSTAHFDELENLRKKYDGEKAALQRQLEELQHAGESRATESASEVEEMRSTIAGLQNQIEATNATVTSLRARIVSEDSRNTALELEKAALVSKTHFLEGNQEAQSHEFTTMRQQLQDAISSKEGTLVTLRKEEMMRRKLNATILELRGNIRVFVRLRPLLAGEEDPAKVDYPDVDSLDGGKEMVVHAPMTFSATGKERNEKHNYGFDRVFSPATANGQVFDDCRDLIQSVIDGYNVSILSYGQTGSGKTYGMSGPNGIIPSAIAMLLAEMHRLDEKGWQYNVAASFVEVYNETINDLLGDAKTWDEGDDLSGSVRGKRKEKHEIHHDPISGKTTVTNLSSVSLWPPPENDGQWPPAAKITGETNTESYTEKAVNQLLDTAAKNRRVAATKSNERSSRSHSIFVLTLRGRCEATGESSEGVLNLVDLAGSERLKQSGAEGNRAKETAAINKSLSSLGDVIAALGNKKGDESHIPYRNSKLTYLLQSSLGGTAANGKSSRTLMLLHLSPLQAHWQESRSSLLFGSKVHGTHIGAAKKK
ncbi:kinesin-like nuclear fusion protein [Recurvomyces mirabilis]|uniref:Kinesin-like protein n=1 Tax=Recurvomyces mirabilis TaxID=574656 RepID=A0AAE1C311_9PEZI|nr:kinesin-like nuclear fusion protein [Recurvomyces mirabilis]KAK5153869.1 kinesin-like nuclear fusion protein [Recurvomyces mirabilis]